MHGSRAANNLLDRRATAWARLGRARLPLRTWEGLIEGALMDVILQSEASAEAAALLGKSSDWVSRGLREKTFVYADGSPVEPVGAGRGGRRRFTGPMVRAMAFSAYRRGTLSPTRLQEVLAELAKGNKSVIPANQFIDIPARQIRKAEVDAFWADLKAKPSPRPLCRI
jgi:hypothetical protein